jgi:hypothetical protein
MVEETWIDGDIKVSAEFATCGECLERPDCPINKFRDLVMENQHAITHPHYSFAALAIEAGLKDSYSMEGPEGSQVIHNGGFMDDGTNGRFETYFCEHDGFGVIYTQQNDMVNNPPVVIDPEVIEAESEELWGPDSLNDSLPSDKFQKNKFTKWVYGLILKFEAAKTIRNFKNLKPPQ